MTRLRRLGPLLVLAVLVGWLLLLRPTGLGGPASYIVVSGKSMEPTLYDGDLVVLKKQDSYSTGEVVTYEVPGDGPGAGTLVIHRVIGGDSNGFKTQGDNRDTVDSWRPTSEEVRGELWFHVPKAGQALAAMREPTIAASVAGGITVFLLLMGKPRRREEENNGTEAGKSEAEPIQELQDA